jgi:hypothetical protein
VNWPCDGRVVSEIKSGANNRDAALEKARLLESRLELVVQRLRPRRSGRSAAVDGVDRRCALWRRAIDDDYASDDGGDDADTMPANKRIMLSLSYWFDEKFRRSAHTNFFSVFLVDPDISDGGVIPENGPHWGCVPNSSFPTSKNSYGVHTIVGESDGPLARWDQTGLRVKGISYINGYREG